MPDIRHSLKDIVRATNLGGVAKSLSAYLPYKWAVLDKSFFEWSALLHSFETKSKDEIVAYQVDGIKERLRLAYEQTVYYRQKYDQAGYRVSDFKSLDDLPSIPVVSRSDLQLHADEMVLDRYNIKRMPRGHTSGTTGTPAQFPITRASMSREWASICYQWERVGFSPGDGRVQFRGLIETDAVSTRLNPERILQTNIINMNEATVDSIIKSIQSSGYRYYHGYPSAIAKWCSLLLQTGRRPDPPKVIMLASEMVQEWQLELIRQVFPESRIFAHYGVAEGVMLGGWWEEVEKYHFMPIYGVVERNPENGALIGSSLIHDALMLIRYQTSDVVSWLSSPAANGPAHLFPVAEALEGRLEDYTYNVRGEAISPALVTFPFKDLTTITGCKIIQWEERRIEILVETGRSRSEIAPEMDVAINGLRVLYGDEMQFDITIVERFEVSRSGKFKWIDCRIQRES